jgi:hypothetical protein
LETNVEKDILSNGAGETTPDHKLPETTAYNLVPALEPRQLRKKPVVAWQSEQ